MNSEEFKKDLLNPKNIYCLVSTDSKIVDIYVDRFKKAINANKVMFGRIKPYGKLFKAITLNVLYMPKLSEEIFDRPEYIFIYTDKIDKRSSIYKKNKDHFIEIQNDYTSYIMKHSNMNQEEAKKFSILCNNDLGIISNSLYLASINEEYLDLITDYSNDIYAWVDAFIKKEPLPRCIESPISIMALLSTNCQNILKVKHKDTKGLNPYLVMNINNIKDYREEQELYDIISTCFYLDCQIKKGLIDINNVLNYLICKNY